MSDTTSAVEATDFQENESEDGTVEDKAVGLQLSFNHWFHLFVTGLQAQKKHCKSPVPTLTLRKVRAIQIQIKKSG